MCRGCVGWCVRVMCVCCGGRAGEGDRSHAHTVHAQLVFLCVCSMCHVVAVVRVYIDCICLIVYVCMFRYTTRDATHAFGVSIQMRAHG